MSNLRSFKRQIAKGVSLKKPVDMDKEEYYKRRDEASRTKACDHEVGICWGKPLDGVE